MKRLVVNRKAIVTILVVFLGLGASGKLILQRRQATSTAFNTAFASCIKPRHLSKRYDPYSDPANIPCYQQALKVGQDHSAEFLLANLLVGEGRYAEAKPLYEELAQSYGVDSLTGRQEAARQMLQPGAMQKMKAEADRSTQARRDLLALNAKNEREESDFLKTHATMDGMRIISMSEADKQVWLRMREQHGEEERALGRL